MTISDSPEGISGYCEGKDPIATIPRKNAIVKNIAKILEERDGFLIIGHRNPDEDCIASMVALGLLAAKFNRSVCICTTGAVHEQYAYLLNICTYNSISVVTDGSVPAMHIGVVALLDTPKPSMIGASQALLDAIDASGAIRMEIDHHIGTDACFFGDPGYRLVDEASSASELVGYLAMKFDGDRELKRRHHFGEILSRNLVLAVLTGVIADSRMGRYLKTRRERWFFAFFSSIFDKLLAQKTRKGSHNFSSKEDVFDAIISLSTEEERCFRLIKEWARSSPSIEYIIIGDQVVTELRAEYGEDTLTAVTKAAADALAEEGGKLGMVAFRDDPAAADLVQYRLRRSQAFKSFDLRTVLEKLSIANGGGHPGAIGFRFPGSEVPDIEAHAHELIGKIGQLVAEASTKSPDSAA